MGLDRLFLQRNIREIIFVSAMIAMFVVWSSEILQSSILYPLRFISGLYLASFPIGFLLLTAIGFEKDMSKLELVAFSIALSIVVYSFSIIFASIFFNVGNDIWTGLRILFSFSIIFYLIGKMKYFILSGYG